MFVKKQIDNFFVCVNNIKCNIEIANLAEKFWSFAK